jgi:hypothetical protein
MYMGRPKLWQKSWETLARNKTGLAGDWWVIMHVHMCVYVYVYVYGETQALAKVLRNFCTEQTGFAGDWWAIMHVHMCVDVREYVGDTSSGRSCDIPCTPWSWRCATGTSTHIHTRTNIRRMLSAFVWSRLYKPYIHTNIHTYIHTHTTQEDSIRSRYESDSVRLARLIEFDPAITRAIQLSQNAGEYNDLLASGKVIKMPASETQTPIIATNTSP